MASVSALASYTVELPLRTVSELNVRNHWARRARRVKEQRFAVAATLIGQRLPQLPCVVTITRIAPRALDDDNLRGALKAARDGVADALGIDDRDERVRWLYEQRRGAPKAYGVEICVARG